MRALVKPEDTPTGRLRWAIADASRRFGGNASRIGQAFANSRKLQHADFRALMAIIEADTAGTPLTPGRLQRHVGLSSAGTSYVIDRLEKAGHIRRVRDHPTDHRVIHLHHTELGARTARGLALPLTERTYAVLDAFDEDELKVILRFMEAAADELGHHLDELEPPG